MTRLIQNLVTRKAVLALAAVVGLGSIAAIPQTAKADFRIGFDIRDGGRSYERQETRVWVQPVYHEVCQRVWVGPTYQTISQRVWVPDRYEERQIVRNYGWQRRVECVRVLVQPAHYEFQSRQVEVARGHWEDQRQQVLVSPGHWETRVDRVACADDGPRLDRLHIEFGHR